MLFLMFSTFFIRVTFWRNTKVCALITRLSLRFKTLPRHWIVYQSKNIRLEHPKTILVRPGRLDVKIECKRIDCTEVFLSADNPECWFKLFCLFFFFPPISTSSCDPSNWLGAQNAASALCCGPWEGLGVGQGWHRQCDAGKVWSPSKNKCIHKVPFTKGFVRSELIQIKAGVAHVHLRVYTLIDSCPFPTECQCVRIDPWLQISDSASDNKISSKYLLWMD